MRSASIIALTTLALAMTAQSQRRPHHPAKLFNGEDLSGWRGNPALWSVVDGVITGVTAAEGERRIEQSSFLVYTASTFDDFELTLKARVSGGNHSGIQYRSNLIDPDRSIVAGYQLSIRPRKNEVGMVFEERGRGILASRGTSVRTGPGSQEPTPGRAWVNAPVDITQWNEYHVTARGSRIVHKVNGEIAATIVDDDVEKRSLGGVLALQLQAGAAMKLEVKDVVVRRLDQINPAPPKQSVSPRAINPPDTPTWIWATDQSRAGETVDFRRQWDQKGAAQAATLTITCDDAFSASLNGTEVGSGDSWQTAYEFDVTGLLTANSNTLAIRATNASGATAGLIARLTSTYADGSTSTLFTDGSWLANTGGDAPEKSKALRGSTRDWQPCHVIGALGTPPWGDVFAKPAPAIRQAPAHPTTLPGFKLDKIYAVPADQQGSWVALANADRGRLVASAEDGGLYYIEPAADSGATTRVAKIDLPIGHANGLLWAFDSLYVCVNGPGIGGHSNGLYRIVDLSGDGNLDTIRTIRKFDGSGEHGPHGVILGPDPVSLYVVCGKRTAIPDNLARSRPAPLWGDDQAGGWICITRPEGREWILHSVGHRNAYDIAFDHHGNLFTCDADSPSDHGLPGFRPAAVYHVPEGADLGFREGAENLPRTYPDALPATIDLAPGSPTGISFGYGADFPARYQKALFTCDWTRTSIDATHLEPSGASYRATSETFVIGAGLRITDLTIGHDGAMYFITGGRAQPSALWRVTYTGDEATTPFSRQPFTAHIGALHESRQRLGKLQDVRDIRVIPDAWQHLSHTDRFIRDAARGVVEHHDVRLWLARFEKETNPAAVLEAAVALARAGRPEHLEALVKKLAAIDFKRLSSAGKIAYLRAHGLAFIRLGEPSSAGRDHLIEQLSPHFPSGDEALDVELCRLLVYLEAPEMVAKTLPLIASSKSALSYATLLRNVKHGWTPEAIANYLDWHREAAAQPGGSNYRAHLEKLSKIGEKPVKNE